MQKKVSILKFLSSLLTIAIIVSTFSGMTLTVFAAELGSPNITSVKATSSKVTIKWEAVSGADAYRIKVYDYAMGNDCICTKTVTSTSVTIKDLEYGVRYFFDVFSLDKKNGKYVSSEYSSKTDVRTTPKDEDNITDNFRYKVSGKNAIIVGYTGTKTKITIPSVINGKKVTAIGDEAFIYSELKEVIISEGIKKIGSYSFAYCWNLNKLVIPESVENISSSAWFLMRDEDGKWLGGTIYGVSGSEAEKYAKEQEIPFKKASASSNNSIDDEKELSEKTAG